MKVSCRNIGCNHERNGFCTNAVPCGGADFIPESEQPSVPAVDSQADGSISFEFLKAKDEECRRKADENQSEYREYRQMAWACRFVMEIWNDESNDKITSGESRKGV